MEFIFTSDLKSVQFESQETSYHSNQSAHHQDEQVKADVKSTNRERIEIEHKLEVNRHFTFRQLAIPKGSIRPQFPDLSDGELNFLSSFTAGGTSLSAHTYQTVVGMSAPASSTGCGSKISMKEHFSLLHAALPDEMLPIAKYARIMYRNLLQMEQVYQQEYQALNNYRAQCFNTELLALGEIDSEAVPHIDLAIELLQEKYQQYEGQLDNRFTHVEEVKDQLRSMTVKKEIASVCTENAIAEENTPEDVLRNYFYQAENGALIFLHPLSTRILADYYQSKLPVAEDSSSDLGTTETVQELVQHMQFASLDEKECSSSDVNSTISMPPPPPGFAAFSSTTVPSTALTTSSSNIASSRSAALSKSSRLPLLLKGKVVDIEKMKLTKATKQKFQFLRHLPQYSEITVVELDMKPLVSKGIYQNFVEEIHKRQLKRKEKQRMENLEKKLSEETRFVCCMKIFKCF